MRHFMMIIDPDFLGAAHFTDEAMEPKERTLTIKGVAMEKPPGGGKPRPCFSFDETPKRAFFAAGQIKRLATGLKCADVDKWIGVKIVVTCAEVKDPRTGGTCMGMVIVRAARPKSDAETPATEPTREPGQDDEPRDERRPPDDY